MTDTFTDEQTVLAHTCDALFSIDPLQKKAVLQHLASLDAATLAKIEALLGIVTEFLNATYRISLLECAQAYSKMCRDILVEQIKFAKTGQYSASRLADVKPHVYDSEETMSKYMYGLALSIFLWPNHLKMYEFFIAALWESHAVEDYLEIGPGHGLFILQALKRWPLAHFTAVDISPTSAKISSAFVRHCFPEKIVDFHIQDINQFSAGQYDFITMGEVLEHVENPIRVLKNIRKLLKPNGRCFISTCANLPVADHIYLFHDTKDMRDHITQAGLEIMRDITLNAPSIAAIGQYADKIGINYAAIVRRCDD